MNDALSIRLAHHDDLDGLVRLLGDCIGGMQEAGINQWDAVYPTRETLRRDLAEETMYVGLVAPGILAGSVVLNEYQNPEYATVQWTVEAARVAVVHRLMVAPPCQKRGIARALMHFAEARAGELGYGAIRLDAFTGNPPALRLYHGLAYRDAGSVTFRKGVFRCFEKRLAGR